MINKIGKAIGEIYWAILRTIATIIVTPFVVILWAILGTILLLALFCYLMFAVFCDIWGIKGESIYDKN